MRCSGYLETARRRLIFDEFFLLQLSLAERKTQNKRGAQKEAAERFGISTVTISSWMKASKAKRGRKPGTKNTTAPKTQPLAAAQPADLRRRYRLCHTLACIFSVILHKFCLTGVSLPALNLYNLTKNLTKQSLDNNYAVLP